MKRTVSQYADEGECVYVFSSESSPSAGPDLGVLVVARLSVGVITGGGVSMGGRPLPVGCLLHVVVVVAAVARHLVGQAVRGRHHIWGKIKAAGRRVRRVTGSRGAEISEATWTSGGRPH